MGITEIIIFRYNKFTTLCAGKAIINSLLSPSFTFFDLHLQSALMGFFSIIIIV